MQGVYGADNGAEMLQKEETGERFILRAYAVAGVYRSDAGFSGCV